MKGAKEMKRDYPLASYLTEYFIAHWLGSISVEG